MHNEAATAAAHPLEIPGLGTIVGTHEGSLIVYRGVRYAEAPVGKGRFAPPIPVAPWEGTRDARQDGPIAPQTPSRVFAAMGSADARPQDEDCLSLTIWTPSDSDADASASRPVMVWLHGGGFSTGAGSLSWYDARRYAEEHGIVVVAANYRLGALGYLSLPGVLPGNLAVLDQLEAVRWVQRHIASFGGNPDNVTLVGQSGGGHTIASFLTIPEAEGLFRRAILQSPPLGIGLTARDEAAHRGNTFLEQLGLSATTPDLLDRLREFSVDDILGAQTRSAMALGAMAEGDLSPPFKPTDALPHTGEGGFVERAAKGAVERSVDILIGWTRDEARLFLGQNPALGEITSETVARTAGKLFAGDAEGRLADVEQRHPGAGPDEQFLDLVTDHAFRLPSLAMASRVAEAGGKAYVYRFDWASPNPDLGACHCVDLPFTFGAAEAWAAAPMLDGSSVDEREAMAGEVMRRWAGFIHNGNPGFEAWSKDGRPVLHLDRETRIGDDAGA